VGSDAIATVRLEARGLGGAYEGADILVYRVPKPLAFLAAQKNLHRIEVKPVYTGESAANGLRYLWSQWNRQARAAWQRVFAAPAREAVVARAPEVRGDPARWPLRPVYPPQFAPLPGFELVDRFRYPIAQAQSIEPPKDVRLPGSSSEFIVAPPGNVRVPIGRRAPGLYLVEAVIGGYRAATLVFVADTVALTKIASGELLVWTVSRQAGEPVAGVQIAWTDGVGTLQSGRTGGDGTVVLRHASPERTYVIGTDAAGGVFVSENFYYDSEIYDAKLYVFTDRPLYRPGDTVNVKLHGREFKDARHSMPLREAPLALTVVDPAGSGTGVFSLKDTDVPVISFEAFMYDNADWVVRTDDGSNDFSKWGNSGRNDNDGLPNGVPPEIQDARDSLYIKNSTHPITQGFSGKVKVYVDPYSFNYGIVSADADVLATIQQDGSFPTLFVYEKGDKLADGSVAPNKRIGLFLGQIAVLSANTDPVFSNLTADGKKLLLNTVVYAAGPPPAPTLSLARSAGGFTITFTGTLQSADSVTGQWTDLPDASPLPVQPSGSMKFYRAKQNN